MQPRQPAPLTFFSQLLNYLHGLGWAKLGQVNVFTAVCHFVHRGGGICFSACWDTHAPP